MSASKDELPVVTGVRDSPPIEFRTRNRKDEIRLVVMGVAALVSYLGLPHGSTPIDILAVGASLIGGNPVFMETSRALPHRFINMEVSMTVPIVSSLLLAQFTAAFVVTFLVLPSQFIQPSVFH